MAGLPLFVSTFWTALTFIDALAVVLLLAKPRYGRGADGCDHRQ